MNTRVKREDFHYQQNLRKSSEHSIAIGDIYRHGEFKISSVVDFLKEKWTEENGYEKRYALKFIDKYGNDTSYHTRKEVHHYYYTDLEGNNVDITYYEVRDLEKIHTKNAGETTADFLKRVLELDPSITVNEREATDTVGYYDRQVRKKKEFTYTELEEFKVAQNYDQWLRDRRAPLLKEVEYHATDSILAEMEFALVEYYYTPQTRETEKMQYALVTSMLTTMDPEDANKEVLESWKTKVTPIIEYWKNSKAYFDKTHEHILTQDEISCKKYIKGMLRFESTFTAQDFTDLMTQLDAEIEAEKNPPAEEPPAEDPLATEGTAEEPATTNGEEGV